MAASAYGGYWYGKQAISPVPVEPVVEDVAVEDSIEVIEDSVAISEPIEKLATESTASETTSSTQEVTSPAKEEEPSWKKYEAMDVRVRTGAYHIIGTDREVKVRKGETLSRIARRELGEGMSCYIEVYNGLQANTELKEGQIIKIPKLKWKKQRRTE